MNGMLQVLKSLALPLLLLCGSISALAQNAKPPAPAPPSGDPVFTIAFEAKGFLKDLSSTSSVKVHLAPGPIWHGGYGTYRTGGIGGDEDTRSPAALYKVRGGLAGLRPGEHMCFGVVGHSGVAHSSEGETVNQPNGPWTIEEDAARFERTQDGGVLICAPMFYSGDAPSFGLLGPGSYDYTGEGDIQYQRLIRFRFTNDELLDLKRVVKVNAALLSSKDGTVRQQYQSSLTATPPADETEVSVETESSYEGWIPEGNLDQPEKPGNNLIVKLEVHKKGDPSTVRTAKLSLSLPQVSKNEGVCMNWPAESAAPKEGLRFRKEDFQEGGPLVFVDDVHIESTEEIERAEVKVHAYDFGAWGSLHVAATYGTGKEATVKVRGKDTPDLSIPMDDNANRIADGWEKAWAGGLRGQATDDEDSSPQGDGCTGDALSLYEEYRGFRLAKGAGQDPGGKPQELVTGLHVRTNPRVKDVFVCDQLGLGIGFFRQSGLCVHLVQPEECAASREGAFNPHVINPHRVELSLGEQYVLWIESGIGEGKLDPDDEGGAYMKPGGWVGPPGPPRDCKVIWVMIAAEGGPPGAAPAKKTLNTITHELAHACSVKHHGEARIEIEKAEYLMDQTDNSGNPKKKGNIEKGEWLMSPQGGGSVSSGDTHCYMSYKLTFIESSTDARLALWEKGNKRHTGFFYDCPNDDCVQNRFCGDRSTWHIGLPGDAAKGMGNCAHQFCVNHLKHK